MIASRRRICRCGMMLLLTVTGLSGCASLPSTGPTAHQIRQAQARLTDFDIVDIDQASITRIAHPGANGRGRLAALAVSGEVDLIGPGDVLQISVYEVGASLFGSRSAAIGFASAAGTGEPLPPVAVGRDGGIMVPWVGRVTAAGKTPDQLALELSGAYRRSSENPQVMVTIRENVSNTVVVQGAVRKPGRVPLTLARERVLDAIAIAGGSETPTVDSIVTVTRGDKSVEQPLSSIDAGSSDDVALLPQDRVALTPRPQTFTVLGATGKVAEIPFQNPRVSLVEAIGRSGGLDDSRADPAAIFVFRYEPARFDGTPMEGSKPVAYRLNMRMPQSYFLAQRFEMRPRDVVYMANAGANIPTKAIQILNLFFSPFYTARTLTQ